MATLREMAEAELARMPRGMAEFLSVAELQRELQVQQIELAMQNEELRRARLALEESRERYDSSLRTKSALLDSPHQFICLLSTEGRLIEANVTLLDFAGLSAQDVAGLPLWETPWWLACQRSRQALRDAIPKAAGGLPVRFPGEWIGVDGRTAFVDVSLRPVRNAADEVTLLILEAKNVTGRRQAEDALRDQEALTAHFFRASPVGMVMFDRNLRYMYINEALAEMNGVPVAAHLGKRLDEVIPDLAPDVCALYGEVLATNTPVFNLPISGRVPAAPDEIRHWSVSLFPVPDADGKRKCLGGVVVEISERVQAEAALQAKTRELREAQRLARVGSWEWLPASDTLIWSPGLFHITGLPPEEGAPRKAAQAAIYRPEGWRQLRQGFKGLLAGADAYKLELEVLRPDGESRWVIARGEAERDAAGGLVKVRGTVQDITERKLAEDNTRELSREVMDLYQNAPCGYHSLDADGRILRINDTELRWLGYGREELLGRKFTDILSPASQRHFSLNFFQLRRQGRLCDVEYEMVRQDGHVFPVLLNAAAVFDDQGRFVMNRATVVDMTEQKRLAEERTRQDARRAEISRHLISVQEEERRRLALEVHDVVSPNIAAVLINLGIVQAGVPLHRRDDMGRRLEDIRRLLQETNRDLRAICANLRPSVLDYSGLFATVDNYAQQFAERTGIAVGLDGTDGVERLPADVESLLFRIVQEALTNCAKHARATEISIQLSHDGRHAHLEIADDGVGFDLDGLSEAGQRPGLGLLTMGERAEFAGGRFQMHSRPGQGTRIVVEI